MADSFTIQFQWQQKPRRIHIRKAEVNSGTVALPVYQVYKSNVYLFSMLPVIDIKTGKSWELIEKDRLPYLPENFIPTLGRWIDIHYLS